MPMVGMRIPMPIATVSTKRAPAIVLPRSERDGPAAVFSSDRLINTIVLILCLTPALESVARPLP